jgi:NAD(P)-dependent dehydrogenase (short-subunit alcohol dehydrogenase family)
MPQTPPSDRPVAIVTGASRGLGLALAEALVRRGFSVVIDARGRDALVRAAERLGGAPQARAIAGSVADEHHRAELIAAAADLGRLDLLVNNASLLGPSPQPPLASYPLQTLREVYETNVVAPLALVQAALPLLAASRGRILNISSDAAVAAYDGWGGYGSSKAALDQLTAILGAEHPELRVWSIDPGDMRTQMHQDAFPGEDISDRPEPAERVPALLALLDDDAPSGRYVAEDLLPAAS